MMDPTPHYGFCYEQKPLVICGQRLRFFILHSCWVENGYLTFIKFNLAPYLAKICSNIECMDVGNFLWWMSSKKASAKEELFHVQLYFTHIPYAFLRLFLNKRYILIILGPWYITNSVLERMSPSCRYKRIIFYYRAAQILM